MKLIKFDSVGGASGDMILGALVGLGASIETITESLQSMNLDPFFLSEEDVVKEGIKAKKVTVHLGKSEHDHSHHHEHTHEHHDHEHDHEHHEHGHGHGHVHVGHDHDHHHHHEYSHRHLSEILTLIDEGQCPDEVKTMAKNIFQRLGEAEASVHGIPLETVHFHEVGAMDSIVDILGACVAYHQLGVDGVICGPLPVGQGWFDCAHGRYPLPPPATERLLQGFKTQATDINKELVTPTGAAILSTWHNRQFEGKSFISLSSAFGAGDRNLPGRPNVLRASLIEIVEDAAPEEEILSLETNLDDTTGETLAYVQNKLLDAGALDVILIPCTMKKGRPGTLLQVLCEGKKRTELEDILFQETGTLGVRWQVLNRSVLKRSEEEMQTRFGPVRIKLAYYAGDLRSMKPEMDDCIQLAEKNGVTVSEIKNEVMKAYASKS